MSTTTSTTKSILRAEGFSCPSCVAKIEKRVGKVKHDPALATTEDLVAAIAKAGYTARAAAF